MSGTPSEPLGWQKYTHRLICGHVEHPSPNGSAGTEWCATCGVYQAVIVTRQERRP